MNCDICLYQEKKVICFLVNISHLAINYNKGLGDWTELMGVPDLTMGDLDRIVCRYELFNIIARSYELEH